MEYVLLLELDHNNLIVATKPTTDLDGLCRVGDRLRNQGIGYIICPTDDVKLYINN